MSHSREFLTDLIEYVQRRSSAMAHDIPSGERSIPFDRTDRSTKRADMANDVSGIKFSFAEVVRLAGALLMGAAIYWGLSGRVDQTGTKGDAQYAALSSKIDSVKDAMTSQAEIQRLRDDQAAKDTAWLKGQVTMQGLDIRNIQIALAEKGFKIGAQ